MLKRLGSMVPGLPSSPASSADKDKKKKSAGARQHCNADANGSLPTHPASAADKDKKKNSAGARPKPPPPQPLRPQPTLPLPPQPRAQPPPLPAVNPASVAKVAVEKFEAAERRPGALSHNTKAGQECGWTLEEFHPLWPWRQPR
eukprot:gene6141-2750_t